MATSYGYVERNLENDVNWGAVGKGFSDMLIAERDEREAKKASLDDIMMETQDGISKNAPLGYNTDFNDRMIDFASNSSAFVLAANKDLKSGRITPEEYMRKLQKINSGADTVFGLANNFNSWYEDKLKRMDSKESGAVEQATFEIMSKLVDFNKHDFVIDKSGMVVAAPLVKGADGIVRPDAANTRSVQAIFNLAQNTVNRLDVDTAIQNKIKLIAKRVVSSEVAASYAREGREITKEGLRYTHPKEYEKLKIAIAKEMTASDLDIASILSDYRNDYEVTGDAAAYDKNKNILLDLSGPEVNVVLTDEQRAAANQIIYDAIDFQSGGSYIQKASSQLAAPASDSSKMSAKEKEAYLKRLDPNYMTWGEFVLKHSKYVDKQGNTVQNKILPSQFNRDFEGYDLVLTEVPPTKENGQKKTTFTLTKSGTPILENFTTTDAIIKRLSGNDDLISMHNNLYEQVGGKIASRDAGTVRGGPSSLNANTWGQTIGLGK